MPVTMSARRGGPAGSGGAVLLAATIRQAEEAPQPPAQWARRAGPLSARTVPSELLVGQSSAGGSVDDLWEINTERALQLFDQGDCLDRR